MSFTRCVKREGYALPYRYILIMKLTVFLTFAMLFQAIASSHAQKLTISVQRATLEEVMTEIQRQEGYSFFFLGKDIASTPISVELKQASLKDAMLAILEKKELDWYMKNKTIVIRRRKTPDSRIIDRYAERSVQQQRIIRGR